MKKTVFQFYALEQHPNNFKDKLLSAHDFIQKGDKFYTPFSGQYDSADQAKDFLRRNGEYWQKRGVTLELFKDNKNSNSISLK